MIIFISSIQFNIFLQGFISSLYVLISLIFFETILDLEETVKLVWKRAMYTSQVFFSGCNLHNYSIMSI